MIYLFDTNSSTFERIVAIEKVFVETKHPYFDYAFWLSVVLPLVLGIFIVCVPKG